MVVDENPPESPSRDQVALSQARTSEDGHLRGECTEGNKLFAPKDHILVDFISDDGYAVLLGQVQTGLKMLAGVDGPTWIGWVVYEPSSDTASLFGSIRENTPNNIQISFPTSIGAEGIML